MSKGVKKFVKSDRGRKISSEISSGNFIRSLGQLLSDHALEEMLKAIHDSYYISKDNSPLDL